MSPRSKDVPIKCALSELLPRGWCAVAALIAIVTLAPALARLMPGVLHLASCNPACRGATFAGSNDSLGDRGDRPQGVCGAHDRHEAGESERGSNR